MSVLLDWLREMTKTVPSGGAVMVPRDWLEGELETLGNVLGDVGDFTVQQVAEALHRPESTIRDWLESDRFAGAYKRGRMWRVPQAAIETIRSPAAPQGDAMRLDAWRRVRRSRP